MARSPCRIYGVSILLGICSISFLNINLMLSCRSSWGAVCTAFASFTNVGVRVAVREFFPSMAICERRFLARDTVGAGEFDVQARPLSTAPKPLDLLRHRSFSIRLVRFRSSAPSYAINYCVAQSSSVRLAATPLPLTSRHIKFTQSAVSPRFPICQSR